MDLNEITKVANRKRLNEDAGKLREKLSRETAKIIKLKVSQDTAYWDLKEKLQQVEGNHERLQQNMVEVQMQHEAISGQYQDELRLRPETLNKVSTTREICDVLEEYSERLKATVSRCKEDQASLYEAYRKSGQLVRDVKTKHERADERNRQLIENLQEKLKLTSEHQNQLVQYLTAAKQQSDAELSKARGELAAAVTRGQEQTAAANELARQLEQRDTTISTFQKEAEQIVRQFTTQITILKNEIADKDKNIKENNEENESLKRALSNQDVCVANVREQNSQLLEQVAARDQQLQAAASERQRLADNLQNSKKENEDIKNDMLSLQADKERVDTILSNAEAEILNLKEAISNLEIEKVEMCSQLAECQTQLEGVSAKFAELQDQHQGLVKTHDDLRAEAETSREELEAKIKEQSEIITTKDKELDSKAGTIAQLMGEVRTATDGTTKVEGALGDLRQEMDAERGAARLRDDQHAQQLERLRAELADKENELTKQMSIILDMRNEKEGLLKELDGMRNKIDNIQKELATPRKQVAQLGDAPEQDDNAVPFALTPRPSSLWTVKKMDKPSVVPPSKLCNDPKELESMVFSLFSDSSMEGDNVLDRNEVNRRFESLSRGEGVAPVPLSALKRRADHGQGAADNYEEQLSLSQLRNNLKNKQNENSKTFFKTKRTDTKTKKMKRSSYN